MTPQEIVEYWLAQPQERLFTADPQFDAELNAKFGDIHTKAAAGDLAEWETTTQGRLALILLLDQMSRNMKRGTPDMFASDEAARVIASKAIAEGDIATLGKDTASWLIMPFMHCETLENQDRCVALCKEHGFDGNLPHAIGHRDIIVKFGRFPHRNAVLGRETTAEEQAFLDAGGFSG